MSGLKQLRNRLKSIKSTQKITKAMQLVSAAKLRKVKEMAEDLNQYSVVLEDMMLQISSAANVTRMTQEEKRFFSKELSSLPPLIVIMTSDRGLCGGFNANIVKQAKIDIRKFLSIGVKPGILVVGKKGRDVVRREFSEFVIAEYTMPKDNADKVAYIIKNKIIALEEEGRIGSCFIYYSKFKNAMTQIFTKEQILPVVPADDVIITDHYEFEGDSIVTDIIEYYISGKINYALLQNKASEEGARMTAMDNATRNAGELIQSLTLKLNRSRQAIITTELTEIIAGAEAV